MAAAGDMPSTQRESLLELTLADAARQLRDGKFSALELAEAIIRAADRACDLNAFATFNADLLRGAATAADAVLNRNGVAAPLHGVPVILKDNINTRGLPTSGGTPALQNNLPGADAPVAARLFSAGALLAGKANLHELSAGGTSNNHVFGAVRNPYDANRIPGGSSGGTAAAVAAGLVPCGLGTDTAGSVRVPAALCGLAGLRSTTGRYPGSGIIPLSRTLDTAGPMARCMEDIVLIDKVISGDVDAATAPEPRSIRLGVPFDSVVAAASESVVNVVTGAFNLLEAAGVTLIPVDLGEIKQLTYKASGALIGSEFDEAMTAYLDEFAPGMSVTELTAKIASPAARRLFHGETKRSVSPDLYREVLDIHLPELRRAYERLFDRLEIDALVFPTTTEIALSRADDDSVYRDGEAVFSWFYFSNTALASMAGNPSLTLPAGLSKEGLPVGISIDGLPGQDRKILGMGRTIEQLLFGVASARLLNRGS